ncbi:hypothetical protein ACQR35_06290 [Pseudarthrobacter sp. J1738]|uniref:hypothetical protein n=1 Tax=unclassified Pseudarthrobacter TaxID=2647000 RepID=UPI003D2BEE7F
MASAAQKPTAPALKTYTFPDGHISFAFPANWQVRAELGPTIPGGPLDCYQAVLTDQRGKEMAFMVSGFYGDGAAGPVDRHVFDSAPVPGLADFGGEPSFGFVRDTVPGAGENLLMDIRPAAEFQDGSTSGGSGQLVLPNGVGIFRANVKASGLSSDGAVKAWMRSSDYAQLKAMLLSVSYR